MTVSDASANSGSVRESPDRQSGDELLLDGLARPAARILARAVTVLDTSAMVEVMKGSIWGMGVIATWDQVVCPVLRALGRLPEQPGQEIAVERMVSRAVFEAFASVPRPEPAVPARVLLACADGEQHALALQAVAAAVAEIGISCCSLGVGTPLPALLRAVHRIRPAVAVVWSQTAATADATQLQALLVDGPRRALIAAGPGWATAELPDTVARSDDLTDLVSSIAVAVRAATDG